MSAHGERSSLRAAASAGESVSGTVAAYLIAGPVVYGGLGWLLDRWLDVVIFLPAGLLAGMALALYVVWLRYGKAVTGPTRREPPAPVVPTPIARSRPPATNERRPPATSPEEKP